MAFRISKRGQKDYRVLDSLIKYIPIGVFVMLILTFLFSKYRSSFIEVGKYLISGDSPAVTISTVLIGIYLTLYTLVLTSDVDSIFSRLKSQTVDFIEAKTFKGIIANMLFILFSLLYPVFKDFYETPIVADICYFYIISNFIGLTAYYVLSLKKEKEQRIKILQDKKTKQMQSDAVLYEIKKALKKYLNEN